MRGFAIAVGAVTVGAIVWLSVAADAGALIGAAGWWSLAALAFPAGMAVLAWRFGEPYRGY